MIKAVHCNLEISGKIVRCVAFEGVNRIPSNGYPMEYERAKRLIQEAGYEIRESYGRYMGILRGISGQSYAKQDVLCEVESLVGMVLASSQDEMINLIDSAFDVFERSNKEYRTQMEAQRSARKRGRHALGEDVRRSEFAGTKLTKDLKAWADDQPEGVSELIYNLLIAERDRRDSKDATSSR